MALDNAILQLTAQPPKLENPVDAYQKLMGVRAIQQEAQIRNQQIDAGRLEMQQKQEQMRQQAAINQAYSQSFTVNPATGEANLDIGKMTQHLAASGAGGAIPGAITNFTAAQKAKNDIAEQNLKLKQLQTDYAASHIQAVQDAGYNPTIALAALQDTFDATKDPQIGKAIQALRANPTVETVKGIIDPIVNSSPDLQKVIAERKTAGARELTAQTGAQKEAREQAVADEGAPVRALAATQANAALVTRQLAQATSLADYNAKVAALPPEQQALAPKLDKWQGAESQRQILRSGLTGEQQTQAAQRDQELGISRQRLNIENARLQIQKEADAAGLNLSPEAKEQAAQLYLKTGTLPPMGMGKAGAATRAGIMNRAAEISPGADIGSAKASYGADSGSLKHLQSQRDAVGAFEQTANKNLDLFLEKAKGVVDSGSPLVNIPLRMVASKVQGTPQQAAYDTARQVAINEVAKVTSNPNLSGTLSDSARREVEAFNPQNATLAQTYAVIKTLRADMANRKESLDAGISEIKKRISGGSGPKPEAPKATHRYNPATGKIEAIQ